MHFCGFSFIAIYVYFNLGRNFSVLLLVLIGAEAEVPHLKVDKQQVFEKMWSKEQLTKVTDNPYREAAENVIADFHGV